MRHFRFFSLLSLVVSSALTLGACGADSDDPAATPAPGEEQAVEATLSAKVGPGGGKLTGAEGTPFAGLVVDIPAGALAAETTITVRETSDPTPLPSLAERVGPQFILEGSGSLAAPLSLTLPLDAGSVARFDKQVEDIKVWVRAGDGWTLTEPTAATASSVTIPLQAFTAAAAGVKVIARPFSCILNPSGPSCTPKARLVVPEIPLDQPCNLPEAFCLSFIGNASQPVASLDNFVVEPDAIYFPGETGPGRVNLVRVDLATGANTQPFTEGAALTSSSRRNPAIDADGSGWMGVGQNGNLHLRPGQPPETRELNRNAAGAARTKGGAVIRFAETAPSGQLLVEYSVKLPGATGFGAKKSFPLAAGEGGALKIFPDKGAEAVWVMTSRSFKKYNLQGSDLVADTGVQISPESPLGLLTDADATASGAGKIAGIVGSTLGVFSSAGAFQPVAGFGPVFDLAYAPLGPLFASSSSSPEVFVVENTEPGILPEILEITTEASGTKAFDDRIPRGIRNVPGKTDMVILTQGRQFLLLRQSSSTIQ